MFRKVLIANRGEIALRVLRALRDLQVLAVAIYHHDDRHSPVVALADEAVEIVGDSPTAAYLDTAQILAVCAELGVDAVHPGYGFLSENAGFARALAAAGITFIGPSPDVIDLMGDKITSRDFVTSLGVPVPPSITLAADTPQFVERAAELGFPLVVKASAGGGGKGMSIVRGVGELAGTLRVAASEAQKYFGDNRVYVERYFASARHIEVQVLGDGRNVVHLGERDCSVQRRFQKIVEESPAPGLSPAKREEICAAAVDIARAAHYASAGTVEFLYTDSGEFFFLEMNTRIQVEHPVTEMVTGIDLVAAQIRIAAGEPLALAQSDIAMTGHAIECRICAEDAFAGFLPETGRVLYVSAPGGDGVRFDSGLYQGQRVTTAFDPMLAKLIVHGVDREQALARSRQALAGLVILGVKTNLDYLGALLDHPVICAGAADTSFVGSHSAALTVPVPTQAQLDAVLALALCSDPTMKLLGAATPDLYTTMGHWRN